jgi:hypothetical protein
MAGLQINLYVSISVTWIAALTTLILRAAARRITRTNWGLDDYFCVVAWVSGPLTQHPLIS